MKNKTMSAALIGLVAMGLIGSILIGYRAFRPERRSAPTAEDLKDWKGPRTPPPAAKGPEIIPGVASLRYENEDYGFSMWYPETARLELDGAEGYLRVARNAIVALRLPDAMTAGTNLGEALVVVGIGPDADAAAKCETVTDLEETAVGSVVFGGVPMRVFRGQGVGAGNLYETVSYRAVRNGSCYEVLEMLHSGNIGNYEPGAVTEFDKPRFSGILAKIAQSFAFIP